MFNKSMDLREDLAPTGEHSIFDSIDKNGTKVHSITADHREEHLTFLNRTYDNSKNV